MAKSLAEALLGKTLQRAGDEAFRGSVDGTPVAITWADGHLLSLAEPQAYNPSWGDWRIEHLPLCPPEMNFRLEPRELTRLNHVRRALEGAQVVVNGCDAAREGELIFDEIARFTCLGERKLRMYRLWIDDTTPPGLRAAWGNMMPHDNRRLRELRVQGRARAEADWLWGINLTRFATLTLRGDPDLRSRTVHVGRVQSPVLALIATRCHEAQTHVPEPFYQGLITFENEKGESCHAKLLAPPELRFGRRDADWADWGDLQEREEHIILNGSQKWQVVEGDNRPENENAPSLFDLTELQRTANRLLQWSAKKTSHVAQALYARHNAITYPRTDCAKLPTSMQDAVVARWRHLWAAWLPERFPEQLDEIKACDFEPMANGNFVDHISDHHGIIPTEAGPPRIVGEGGQITDEYLLWELITKRFITAFLPPATVFASSRAFVLAYRPGEQLRALVTAAPVIAAGWLKFEDLTGTTRGFERPLSRRLQDVVLPKMGIDASMSQIRKITQRTHPAELYTYDMLLHAMSVASLGTPATRAQTIDDLINTGYIAENSHGRLIATEEGEKVVALLNIHGGQLVLDPKLTAFWEKQIDLVGRGGVTGRRREDFLGDVLRQVAELGKSMAAPGTGADIVFCPKTGQRVKELEDGWEFPGYPDIKCPRTILSREMKPSEYRDVFMSKNKGSGPYSGFVSRKTFNEFTAWLVFNAKEHRFTFAFKQRRR